MAKKKSLICQVSDLPRIDGQKVFADTEGTGLNKMYDTPFMFQARINRITYIVEWCDKMSKWLNNNIPLMEVFAFHNAKHDYHSMINGGVDVDVLYGSNIYCTFVVEALLDEHRYTYGLDDLGKEYFGMPKDEQELMDWLAINFPGVPKSKLKSKMQYAPREMVAKYGGRDAEIVERLYYRQQPLIKSQELGVIVDLEHKTLKALAEIERRGVPVDTEKLEETEYVLTNKQVEVQSRIVDLVGWPVNPRSPKDMVAAFEKLNLKITYIKKTGNPSFAKGVIDEIHHPFITALKESRGIKTMLDTFIGGSIGGHLWTDGRIHTDFNQVRGDEYGTGTGRLSSSQPNLQQVPKRDGELAPLIRGLFIPPPKKLWISNDWEQFEFRVFAHYTNDAELIARYHADPTTDFHQAIADKSGKPRGKSKTINLGLVFGMGEGKLAAELGLPYTEEVGRNGKVYLKAGPEALQFFNEYHADFPGAKIFLNQASNLARARGYVRTLRGRRIRFPGGLAVHKAGGLVFQGTSADLMKEKTVILNDTFRKTDTEFVLIVHDEFDLLSPKGTAKKIAKQVKEITEDIPDLRVPILAKADLGKTWWEASK